MQVKKKKNYNIVVGVTGGIAAYKALDVVNLLKKQGWEVSVIMTENACAFVNPISFQTLSKNVVITDTFQSPKAWDVEHISLAQKSDFILIAPATANIIGKIANGISDDMLSTTVMAATCPVIFSPAMNTEMYLNPIVQGNIEKLKALGYLFIEPDEGLLACGDTGKGKLPSSTEIVSFVHHMKETHITEKQDLAGKKIMVTAGPTMERLDPVRYITNHSSGKMGFAIAEAAKKRGAEVVLIAGCVNLETLKSINRVDVESTRDMQDAVNQYFDWADVVIKAAAPLDYRVEKPSTEKIKKSSDTLNLKMIKNPDILKELGKNKGNKILIGFAAETHQVLEHAKGKIQAKNLDFIVANNVTEPGAGFKSDTNIVTIIDKDGNEEKHAQLYKNQVANIILDKLV